MAKKLYVGNLSFKCGDDDLHELFSKHGTVESAKVITDRETGRSKGFGFVEMSNDTEATNAITALNKVEYQTRLLTVNEARPRENNGDRGNRRDGYNNFRANR